MPASIADLPLELFNRILDEAAIMDGWGSDHHEGVRTLFSCALVASWWKDPALSHLYRTLRISSDHQAQSMARCASTLAQYHTSSLTLHCNVTSDTLSEILALVSACEGVAQLDWGTYDEACSDAAFLLTLPALSALEELYLAIRLESEEDESINLHSSALDSEEEDDYSSEELASLEDDSTPSGLSDLSIAAPLYPTFASPTLLHLRKLSTNLHPSSIPLLESILNASASLAHPTLTDLRICFDYDSSPRKTMHLELLKHLFSIAPYITSLQLPAMDEDAAGWFPIPGHLPPTSSTPSFPQTAQFLRLATSLTSLRIEIEGVFSEGYLASYLEEVLGNIQHPLQDLTLEAGAAVLSGVGVMKALEQVTVKTGGALSMLKLLLLPYPGEEDLREIEGWVELRSALEYRCTKIVTSDW